MSIDPQLNPITAPEEPNVACPHGAPLERESAVEADAINIWSRCGQISLPKPRDYYPTMQCPYYFFLKTTLFTIA